MKCEIWHDAAKHLGAAAQDMYESRTKSTLRRGSLFVPRRWEGKQDAIPGYLETFMNQWNMINKGVSLINDTESYQYESTYELSWSLISGSFVRATY